MATQLSMNSHRTPTANASDTLEPTLPVQHFVVHSPLVAMKSIGHQKLVSLESRTIGEILKTHGAHGRLLTVKINGELLLVWKRDLEERTVLLPAEHNSQITG